MTGWPNAAEDRLLRSIAPPPLSAGFADRVLAALPADGAPLPPLRPARDRRGAWRRPRTWLIGGIAAGLLSVGAAAAGLLGGRIQNLPVIATIAQAVTPMAPVPAKPKLRLAEKPKPAVPPNAQPAAAEPVAALPVTRHELQREVIAQRIADRIERRQARRAAMGLPSGDPHMRRALRQRLQQVPPAERAALIARVRDIRQERAATDGPAPLATPATQPETIAERRARRAAWLAQLTPEQREALRERRRLNRERRMQRLAEDLQPADPVPAPVQD